MTKPQLNLQDIFLNQVRKENIGVTIYLMNSVQLRGMVRGFDAFTILLETVGRPVQLVYKHSIASIVPARPISSSMDRESHPPQADKSSPILTAVETSPETE